MGLRRWYNTTMASNQDEWFVVESPGAPVEGLHRLTVVRGRVAAIAHCERVFRLRDMELQAAARSNRETARAFLEGRLDTPYFSREQGYWSYDVAMVRPCRVE